MQEAYDYNVIGNMTSKTGLGNYTYGSKPHAVTSTGNGGVYAYDGNGNMTSRKESGTGLTYAQTWNVDNKLASISATGVSAQFYYDADGTRVKTVAGSTTTVYVGNYYENTGGLIAKYYYFGGQRVAVRNTAGLNWLHGDHLGSASVTTNASGNKVAELRYKPFGEVRFSSGALPTNRKFNGNIDDGFGTLDYGARMLSPLLGRFLSADSIVPRLGDPQSLNRYSYARNNPVNRVDPSGHVDRCALIICPSWIEILLGGAASELVGKYDPVIDRQRRDEIGGALVTSLGTKIASEAKSRGLNPDLIGAILRHESGAIERRMSGALADLSERAQVALQGDSASIGPAQMQVARARELENLGYVSRKTDGERISALLSGQGAVEYIAGELQFNLDQLNTIRGFSQLNAEQQNRILLLSYNQGIVNVTKQIHELGFVGLINEARYDNLTLDEYDRWKRRNEK